jgi:hypothetical protein
MDCPRTLENTADSSLHRDVAANCILQDMPHGIKNEFELFFPPQRNEVFGQLKEKLATPLFLTVVLPVKFL